jgi:putative chitinase
MAKPRRKSKKIAPKIQKKNGIFSKFNFTESYASLILGAIVVLIIGILFISFAKGNRSATSSTKDIVQNGEISQDSNTSSTYTIKVGDDLWSISENFYNDGYKWVEIAKINNLGNPGLILAGNKLTIPNLNQNEQAENVNEQLQENTVIDNNSITGSTYTIKSGDNLWDISVRAYGDGYKWPEIARVNNLENPDLIFAGNTLKLPR